MVNRRTHDGRISRRARSKQRTAGLSPAPQGAPPVVTYLDNGTAHAAVEGTTVAEATASATDRPGRLVVLEYPLPGREAIGELAEAWDLHPLLVEDLVNAHQRPKLERYDDVLFIVARAARYNDEAEDVAFSEFHLLVRQGAVAVLCQDGRWVDGTDSTGPEAPDGTGPGHRTLWNDREVLGLGPEAVVYRILDAIVDGYPPVLRGIAIDKEQIERQVFSGDAAVAERIYRLS